MSDEKRKYIGLQILRGFAAWGVVFHHFAKIIIGTNPAFGFWEIFRRFGTFGVDIFFVLSGYIMYNSIVNSKKGGLSFFLDRLFRIFPVYWLMTLFLLVCYFILPKGSYDTGFTGITLFKSFFLIPTTNPDIYGYYPFLYVGWTLVYEMFFYTALSVSLMINRKYAIISTLIFLTLLPFVLNNFFLLGHTNYLLLEFNSGLVIAMICRKFKNNFKNITAYGMGFLFLAAGLTSILYFGWNISSKIISAVCFVSAFIVIEYTLNISSKIVKFFEHLGDISYSTYLVHTIIIGWFSMFALKRWSIQIEFLLLLCIMVLTYIFSHYSFYYIETNKKFKALKNYLLEKLTPGNK
jgi:exopolysaccharide production protein ExoZ